MKKYNVFDIVFDFKDCSEEAAQELNRLIEDFECSNDTYIVWDSEELGPEYPNLSAYIKSTLGDDKDPVLINIWW